jgi:hypothetical protein
MTMRFAGVLYAVVMLLPACAFGQGSQGVITGRVSDPAGVTVAGANVLLTNTATAQTKQSTTNEGGYYTFPALQPSSYTVRVTMQGFKTVTTTMTLDVNQTLANDVQLQVGLVETNVEVQAVAPLIQSETSSTGQLITGQQILQMPLNGRNVFSLSLLVPGASENPGAQSMFSINGARGNQTSVLLDGLDARLFQNGRPAITPSVDAVQEFKIQQNANSAAYGDGLAIINAAIRSGTNGFHGVVWEFLRNNVLDAKPYFSKTAPILRRNQFGFTAGGPIWKDHTFFFGNYEGLRVRTASTFYATVPTAAQLSGNFSGGPQLYNPFVLTNGARTPYLNNQIPASQISQMAKAAAKLYPTPNLAGSSLGNYFASLSIPQNTNQYNIRVDHQLTKKDNILGRFSWTDDQSTGYNSPLAYNGSQGHYKGEQALLHETHIFSPNLLNDFATGWTYGLFSTQLITADHDVATQDFGLSNLKIPAFEWGSPLLSITSVTALGSPINIPSGGYENNYQLDDDVTWTHGAHTVRAGIEVRQYRPALYNQATPNGNLSFDGRYTSLTATSAKVAGSPIADLIIGAPFSATATQLITSDGLIVLRWNQWQGYVQDDWKVTPRLTLNMGMRYVYDVPFREVHGQANVWDTVCNCFLTPGASVNGIDGLIKPDRNNLAPRFGFAYSVDPKTVIRGGAGVYYGFVRGLELSSGYGLNPPFLTSTTVNNGTTAPTLPAGLFPVPVAVVTPTTNLFSVSHTLPNNYTYQYNLTVQRQITPTLALQAAYVGSSSHKLIGRDLVNQARVDANPAAPTAIQARRPYAGAGDISITKAIDQANYNALQVTVEKRPSHGVSGLAAYTYAKSMGIAEAGDQSAIGNEYVPRGRYYGPTVYSQKHRLTVSPTVELPFGKGKAFASSLPAFLDKFVSGWSANSIMTFSTGEYISPTSNISANVGRVDRNFPNCTGDPMRGSGIRTITRWFDTSRVVGQTAGTFGNCSTGVIQVPGQNNIDISAVKNTIFRERYRVEFRSEFFNAFNHASFGQPNVTVGNAQFGVISSTRTNSRQIQFGLKLYW